VRRETAVVKTSKIYERLLSAPSSPIPFRDFERCILGFGFAHWRSRGSHRSYKHPQVTEVLTIQPRGKDAEPYQVRRFLAMVSEYDLEPED
jgi:predicted RNA binding protein YcfA (HicA-like mRNA interferase family)